MGRRITRVAGPIAGNAKQKNKQAKKRKQRGLNAFSIATKVNPERTKVRQHRLGAVEEDGPERKRRRVAEDEDDDESEEQEPKRQKSQSSRFRSYGDDDLDAGGGSDSDGNEWRVGEVNEEDDTDLDSDEAFGESDEERYADFTFRGSTSGKKAKHRQQRDMPTPNLDEDNDEDLMEDDASEASLGSDAVDLATMLDVDDQSDLDEPVKDLPKSSKKKGQKILKKDAHYEPDDEFEGFEDEEDNQENEDEYTDSDLDSSSGLEDSDDANDPEAASRLQNAIASLPRGVQEAEGDQDFYQKQSSQPTASEFLAAMRSASNIDPAFSRSMKRILQASDPSNNDKPNGVVKVPLPKLQQDRLDRVAAYDKAKKTLDRWIDTVKHNRRAEHLSFPLLDSGANNGPGADRLMPFQPEKSNDDLDSAVDDILLQSGLGRPNSNTDHDGIKGDELEPNQVSFKEVVARRNELRKARDLLFREERRARHINKIKSKAYRRVHRKEKERAVEKEKNLLAAAGIELSDDEKEKNDRRRAEERMGARHRESRWAKGVKSGNRAIWDDDARSGMIEMARRDDELRQRIQGKSVRNSDDMDDGIVRDASSDNEDEEDEIHGEEDDTVQNSLFRLREEDENHRKDGATTKLASMGFMQRAEAAQRKLNDETIETIRRDLNGEVGEDESDAEWPSGRQRYGPTAQEPTKNTARKSRNELEEGLASDEGENENFHSVSNEGIFSKSEKTVGIQQGDNHAPHGVDITKKAKTPGASIRSGLHASTKVVGDVSSPKPQKASTNASELAAEAPEEKTPIISVPGPTNGWQTIPHPANTALEHAEHDSGEEAEVFVTPTNEELVRAAFGGDEVEEDFIKEKRAAEESEDEKVIDNALPGWGSWVGEGISQRELNRNKGKFLTREAGVKPANRKDAKLERVILSEKRAKKSAKYLASTLPHPFETKQQYERSLRIPIGPEWTTKESFQNATKPRIMVKQGIIRPMEKPLL